MIDIEIGNKMHSWATDLFPICRSLTGPGVRESLGYLQKLMPDLQIHAVPSGIQAFDWTVPDEWTIKDAYVVDPDGNRVIDFQENNLHIMGYSEPVDTTLELEELQKHLYSLPEQPEAIPYVTSYYKRRWGFALRHRDRQKLKAGTYRIRIDSELSPGVLNYGELILPGNEQKEVLLSTYICHPSMANNELSGPVVATALAQYLAQIDRRYTYRILFLPETIGSIVYLSKHLEHLQKHLIAGFVLTCIGDERSYSYVPSRTGKTLADRAALYALEGSGVEFNKYTFMDRGSDERQYCSPRVNLPVCSLLRSKYGKFPEYHTSLDDLSLVTPEGLSGGYAILKRTLNILEKNTSYELNVFCEPFLSKYNLSSNITVAASRDEQALLIKHISAYADGSLDTMGLASAIGVDFDEVDQVCRMMCEVGILREVANAA